MVYLWIGHILMQSNSSTDYAYLPSTWGSYIYYKHCSPFMIHVVFQWRWPTTSWYLGTVWAPSFCNQLQDPVRKRIPVASLGIRNACVKGSDLHFDDHDHVIPVYHGEILCPKNWNCTDVYSLKFLFIWLYVFNWNCMHKEDDISYP